MEAHRFKLKDYSFVKRSSLRIAILKSLESGHKTPTQLSKELKRSITLISRYLRQLVERDIIRCLTEDERMWKLFSLTDKGKRVLKEVEKLGD